MATITVGVVAEYSAALSGLVKDHLVDQTLQKVRKTLPLQFAQAFQYAMTSPGPFQTFCHTIRGYLERRTIDIKNEHFSSLSKGARRDNSGEQVSLLEDKQAIEPQLNLPARSLHSFTFYI